MLGRQTCVDCGRISPENSGEHTLTTSFGWRLRAGRNAAGDRFAEWRCEACWKRFKATQRAGTEAPPALHASIPGPSDREREPHGNE
jgi:hypothetical protein